MGTDTKEPVALYQCIDGKWTEITSGIIDRIARETENFVLLCLSEHGISKEFLESHLSEFTVNVKWLSNGEIRTYFWNGKKLFATMETTDIECENGEYVGHHKIVKV